MSSMSRLSVYLICLSLVTFGAAATLAKPDEVLGKGAGQPDCLPDAFESDDVRIWFQGLKGHLKVFDTSDNETGLVYSFQTLGVAELTADNTSLAHLNLGRAYPHHSGCVVEDSETWLNITYTVRFAVDGTTGQDVGDSNITFVWHFNKTSSGAKFDLFVEDWPWQADDSELAFDFRVTSPHTIESAENGIGFRDGSDSRGYIEWAPNATAHYADGHEETAIVDSDTTVTGGRADVSLRFTNVTSGYTTLEYDPWVGVGDYLVVGGVLIGLGLLGTAPAAADPVIDLIRRVL